MDKETCPYRVRCANSINISNCGACVRNPVQSIRKDLFFSKDDKGLVIGCRDPVEGPFPCEFCSVGYFGNEECYGDKDDVEMYYEDDAEQLIKDFDETNGEGSYEFEMQNIRMGNGPHDQ